MTKDYELTIIERLKKDNKFLLAFIDQMQENIGVLDLSVKHLKKALKNET